MLLYCRFIKATSPKLSLGVIIGFLLPLPVMPMLALVYSAHSYGLNATTCDCLCWVSILYQEHIGIGGATGTIGIGGPQGP